jgi:hypothetical protein
MLKHEWLLPTLEETAAESTIAAATRTIATSGDN